MAEVTTERDGIREVTKDDLIAAMSAWWATSWNEAQSIVNAVIEEQIAKRDAEKK